VEREAAVARKPVEDAETAIKQVQDDMRNAEKAGLTTNKPETLFEEMLTAMGVSVSNLASSDDEEDGQDEDDDEKDPAGGKLRDDDQPGWVMGTIAKGVQYHMERFRQKRMKLEKLMQPGWGNAADYFHESYTMYWTTEWKVPAVVQPQMADDATSSGLTIFGEPMETVDSIPGKQQMLQVSLWPGSRPMRLGLRKPQTHNHILSLPPARMPNSSPIQTSMHVKHVTFNSCISRPKIITI